MNPLLAAHDRRVARDTWVWRITKVVALVLLFTGMAVLGSLR